MKKRLTWSLLILSVCCASCDEQKQDSPEVRRARVESEIADKDDSEKRAEVIAAAREYLARAFPDWKLNGVSTFHHSDNHYYVFGDISKGDERRTVATIVKLFVEDNGPTYWKAEHSPDEGEQKLPGYVIRPYQH